MPKFGYPKVMNELKGRRLPSLKRGHFGFHHLCGNKKPAGQLQQLLDCNVTVSLKKGGRRFFHLKGEKFSYDMNVHIVPYSRYALHEKFCFSTKKNLGTFCKNYKTFWVNE